MIGKPTEETRKNKMEISGIAPFSTVADDPSDPGWFAELAERTGGESSAGQEARKVSQRKTDRIFADAVAEAR